MRRIELMTAGGVTLGGLGVLVGLAIGSGTAAPKVIAQRAQPIEVRTEVIRKTVNVYRRAKPPHVAAAGPGGRKAGSAGSGASALYASSSAAPRTRTSGIKSAGTGSYAAAPVVSTRTSGAKSSNGSSSQGSGSGTVKTRTSGGAASGGSGSARPVSTKSSGGGGGDNGGGHDD
jgi:hypothetical protein